MDERWIVIPNWDRFQHYKDRNPAWIKLYTELAHDDAWRSLTFHQRGVLVSLWIEYAAGRRQIRDSTATVTRQLGGRVARATLEALNHAGFIQFAASKPLARRYSRVRERERKNARTRVKENTPKPAAGDTVDELRPNAQAYRQFTDDWPLGTSGRPA